MRRPLIVLVLGSVVGLASASTAGAQVRAAERADAQAEAPRGALTGDPDRRICKDLHATGSRLAKAKVCKTAREWAEQQTTHRQHLNEMQKPRKPDDLR